MSKGKFYGIILASDIDKTFYSGKVTPQRNLDSVRYFTENGGRFLFSSGRNHKDIFKIFPDINSIVNAPCVLCNGGFCFDTASGTIENASYLDADTIEKLQNRARELLYVRLSPMEIADVKLLYSTDDAENISRLKETGLYEDAVKMDLTDFDENGRFKLVFVSKPALIGWLFPLLRGEFPTLGYTCSSEYCIEVVPLGVSKAKQLGYIRNKLFPDEKSLLVCAGDYDNDYEMLCSADIAVCPANATEKVKNVCRHVLCPCEDGAIAEAVEIIEQKYTLL